MTQNTQNGTCITTTKIGKCWPCPVFAIYTLGFALQLRKNHGKTSVRVVENYPDISVDVTITYTYYNSFFNAII
jgi:hypothetical protein